MKMGAGPQQARIPSRSPLKRLGSERLRSAGYAFGTERSQFRGRKDPGFGAAATVWRHLGRNQGFSLAVVDR